MNVAFEVESQKEVYAHTLNGRDNLKKLKFTCVSDVCQIPVFAYAIHTNKQTPHFRKQKGQEHHEDCAYSNLYELLRIKGLYGQRIGEGDLKRAGYPSLFSVGTEEEVLEEEEVFTPKNENPGKTIKTVSNALAYEPEFNPFSGQRVKSIQRIVWFFLGYPANRDAKITIDGIDYTYQTLFKEIKAGKKHLGATNLFFYAKVKVSKNKDPKDSFLEHYTKTNVKLFAADFDNNVPANVTNRYTVEINKKALSENKYKRIKKNFDTEYEKMLYSPCENHELYVFVVSNAPVDALECKYHLINGHIYFAYTDIRETINETTFDM